MNDRDRIIAVIDAQRISAWDGRVHPEDVVRLADALIAAGATMPAPQIGCQAGPVGHEGECW